MKAFCSKRAPRTRRLSGDLEELLLLAILRQNNQSYTGPIAALLKEATGRAYTLSTIAIVAGRLEEKGFLKSWMSERLPVVGGRPRRYYAVTKEGIEALRELHRARRMLLSGIKLPDPLK